MAAVVITKKDLTRLGNELLKELYEFFNNEHMLTFLEVKEERIIFIKNLITAEFEKNNYTLIQRDHSTKRICKKISKDEFSKKLECLKNRIENNLISLDVIKQAIEQIKFKNTMYELDEDLYGKVDSFVNLYNVYSHDYNYLI